MIIATVSFGNILETLTLQMLLILKKKHSLKQNYKVSLKGQKNKLKFITKFPRGHRSWSSFITFATFTSFYVK